ncbi:methyltransferase domain-containing protein [Microbacterium sp. W4I20]|uniref:methyltransferase domain-containing protein n=1 Tax=Microbacterium sp. W4I20 TaxID=3042262 RepID=UPI0027843F90|nr:methyltransferase domain-containing protein [Microbacterium sp. W4I20]MDQ0725035.1 2-polyprenyl-3-methyl-5-hydroxy-6-metoxy-1,4-benzoquinol methylase [Microbacterium sp. W4I20]
MRHDLSARDVAAIELMDDPHADERMLARTYGRFGFVNAVVSRPGLLYRRDIRPRARPDRPLRILDVGAGGGDLCRLIAGRLRHDGIAAEVTALDADERAIRWASAQDRGAGVRYRRALTAELAEAGETFDVVLSNHVLHHLDAAELQTVLDDSLRLIDEGGLVSHHDIARSRTAYALFAAATWPLSRSLLADSFIRVDGLISVRRSYTVAELAAVVPSGWTVRGGVPSRLELRWEDTGARS